MPKRYGEGIVQTTNASRRRRKSKWYENLLPKGVGVRVPPSAPRASCLNQFNRLLKDRRHSDALGQRAVQMPFGLASMTPAKSGEYSVRKAIPADEYKKLYDQGWEAKLTLPTA